LKYNPEISPYIFVSVGEFLAGPSVNTLYVVDTSGNIVNQGSPDTTFSDYSNNDLSTNGQNADETFREIGLDFSGNLFIGTFVNGTNLVNIKILPHATNVAGITGGFATLVPWHTLQSGEGISNFSGLDVATGGPCCAHPGDLNGDTLVDGLDI